PKFDLPGEGPHPAMRMLQIAGGLFVVAMLVLGGALWRHHSMQVAAEERAQALIAARAAEANAAIEAAKARAAEAAAKVAAAEANAEAAALAAKASAGGGGAAGDTSSADHHSHHHSKAKGKTLAKADGGKAGQKAAGSSRDDAAIDKLLAKLK